MSLPILGASVVASDAFKQLLTGVNPGAPLEVVDSYYELEGQWGIRADILLSQAILETDYLRSWWSQPPRRNLAGLGVTGEQAETDPQSNAWAYKAENNTWLKGYSFPGWRAAVQAHFAHMSAYVYTDERNQASQLDPRYRAARQQFMARGWLPAKILTDLNGKWAVPGATYGQSIEAVYNKAAALAAGEAPPGPAPKAPAPAPANPDARISIAPTLSHGVPDVLAFLGVGMINVDGAVVRSSPALSSPVLRTVERGTVVQLTAYTDSGEDGGAGTRWFLVDAVQGGGWVYATVFGS